MMFERFKEVQCACERCSRMCQGPCCGTPQEMRKIIEAGFGGRLMFDEGPGGPDLLKPALRGFEGEYAPWQTRSEDGCTFWKDGLCELHDIGLKPIQGRLAHHDLSEGETVEIGLEISDSWKGPEAENVIQLWKEKHLYGFCSPGTGWLPDNPHVRLENLSR